MRMNRHLLLIIMVVLFVVIFATRVMNKDKTKTTHPVTQTTTKTQNSQKTKPTQPLIKATPVTCYSLGSVNVEYMLRQTPLQIAQNVLASPCSFYDLLLPLVHEYPQRFFRQTQIHPLSIMDKPAHLVDISRFTSSSEKVFLSDQASAPLQSLMNAAKKDHVHLNIKSAYISYIRQKQIYLKNPLTHLRPGTNPQQLGLVVQWQDSQLSGKWLSQHAQRYGFIAVDLHKNQSNSKQLYYRYIGEKAMEVIHHYFFNQADPLLEFVYNNYSDLKNLKTSKKQ